MYGTATGVILIFVVLLMPAHIVNAASGNLQSADGHLTGAKKTDVYRGGKKTKVDRLQEKKLAMASQAGGLHEAAMRSPVREIQFREPAAPVTEQSGSSSSMFAMLFAGLGVALISIFRRIGGLS
jgi:hypothetical protein